MPAHSRPKDGVASLAYVAGIHAFGTVKQGVDGRDKPGHDTSCPAADRPIDPDLQGWRVNALSVVSLM
jgi:hypothetical protein